VSYLAIGLAVSLALLALRLYGLRGDVAKARELATAREAERDAVLVRLTTSEDRAARGEELAAKRGLEIARLWGILRRTRSDEALEELMKDELG